MKLKYLAALAFGLTASVSFAGKHDHSLVKKCAKECPGAKTEKEVHECAEKKESDLTFQASACGIAHAKHEKDEKSHSH